MKKMQMPNLAGHLNLPSPKNGADRNRFNIQPTISKKHLWINNQVDHRSYEKQGKLQIPTIHEGADARKIEQKFLAGQEIKGSWKVAENQIIKQQNTLLQKILDTFGKVSGALSLWKERLNDIRRKPGNYTLNGVHDWANRRTADLNGRNASGNAEPGHPTLSYAGTESEIAKIKQRVIRAAQHFAKYRGTTFKMEEQKTKIELLENENQQWQILAQKLNSENSLLLKQNTELLNWNSR